MEQIITSHQSFYIVIESRDFISISILEIEEVTSDLLRKSMRSNGRSHDNKLDYLEN